MINGGVTSWAGENPGRAKGLGEIGLIQHLQSLYETNNKSDKTKRF